MHTTAYTTGPQPADDDRLGDFHTAPARVPSRTGKIVGGLVGALMLAAGGVWLYSMSGSSPPPRVSAAQLPYTPAPAHVTPAAPPPVAQ